MRAASWLILVSALASAAAAPREDPGWRRIEAPLALSFPRDHGAHLDTRTEWWYLTGEVEDEAGARYGWQVTVFRQGLDAAAAGPDESPLRARHALAAHVVLVDVAAGRTRHVERLRRLDGALAWASTADLDVGVEDVAIRRGESDALAVTAGAAEAGFALALDLEPAKPLVLQGEGGVSAKGLEPGNASAYTSWTRLVTRGTLQLDGRALRVRGEAWFDHEWGSAQLGAGVVGWDWTGLRLDDGRELMLYRLRRADGTADALSAGTLVERDGRARRLARADFELVPEATWTSPATGAVYPVAWRVRVPSAGIDAALRARVEACEVDGRTSTGTVYWEGPAALSGSASGAGYLELAGYATSLAERF